MAGPISEDRLHELEARWLDGTITDDEAKEYAEWYNNQPQQPVTVNENHALNKEDHRGRLLADIQHRIDETKTPVRSIYSGWIKYAAAIIIIIAGAVAYFYLNNLPGKNQDKQIANNEIITPGSDKAILTLADGSKVILDSTGKGNIITDNGVKIIKSGEGIITYGNASITATGYNTMSTPRGGKYQVVLPDGSRVWLNAASSLYYPVAFIGNTREVTLQGEAYFDIKENAKQPFIVKTKKMDIAVLGTAFNVNCYDEEPEAATTLVQGSVKINNPAASVILQPGQQAGITNVNAPLKTAKADLEEVLAWKEGKFRFDNADIGTIMRQIARWYDVKINYSGNAPASKFSGSILRTAHPSTLLEVLELTGEIHFDIQGKTINVISGSKK